MVPSNPKRVARYSAPPSARLAGRTRAVCVVDPRADDYQGWTALAQASGRRLKFAASAEEALRFSRTQVIDLWIVNTELPGLSGYELCTMLQIRSAQTAVYLLANEYSPAVEQAAWQARATLFGCKGGHTEWLKDWLQTR